MRGEKCQTVEGLAARTASCSPVQQAVVDGQGFQCAFCMTGFIMATTGFLKTNPNPTRAELAHGISGNLCRCADYNKILDCMMNARRAGEEGVMAEQARTYRIRPAPAHPHRTCGTGTRLLPRRSAKFKLIGTTTDAGPVAR